MANKPEHFQKNDLLKQRKIPIFHQHLNENRSEGEYTTEEDDDRWFHEPFLKIIPKPYLKTF